MDFALSPFGENIRVMCEGDEGIVKSHLGNARSLLFQAQNLQQLKGVPIMRLGPNTYDDGTTVEVFLNGQFGWVNIITGKKEGGKVKNRQIIKTYADGNDITSPYLRYLWSTQNGKIFRSVSPNIIQPSYTYRNGSRTCLTKYGLFWFMMDSSWRLQVLHSIDFGKTFNSLNSSLSFGKWTYFDVQSDERGWIWLITCTDTETPHDYTTYGTTRIYVSKDNGRTFELKVNVADTVFAHVFLTVTKNSTDKLVYFTYFTGYDEFSVGKYIDEGATSVVYSFDAAGYGLDDTMGIAANGDAWTVMYCTENHATGYSEPLIVRNGSIVWSGTLYEALYSHNIECVQIRNSGSNFVAVFVGSTAVDGHMYLLESTNNAVTFTRVDVLSASGRADYPMQSIDIVGDKIILARHAKLDLIDKSTIQIFYGDIGGAMELIYSITEATSFTTALRGDARMLIIDEEKKW